MGTNNSDIINNIHKQVDDVMEVMVVNVGKVKDRGGKLEALDDRAEQLLEAGKVFQKTTKEVAQQEKFKNMKWKIIMGVGVGLLILLLIIIVIVFAIPSSKPEASATRSTTVEGSQ
ncbi:vesicle-associated membrane protein 5-like [Heptranchias perlo]|uniref:vesicle-associated membrane protein 5-like n=1 Tax=Heptranchias perlo TaxID=212740 RepID=UPI0035598010